MLTTRRAICSGAVDPCVMLWVGCHSLRACITTCWDRAACPHGACRKGPCGYRHAWNCDTADVHWRWWWRRPDSHGSITFVRSQGAGFIPRTVVVRLGEGHITCPLSTLLREDKYSTFCYVGDTVGAGMERPTACRGVAACEAGRHSTQPACWVVGIMADTRRGTRRLRLQK
jgi:hypothetical protein|eukprot:COSAG02_NODE_1096_length_14601_cov_185.142946_7_plen_172_part_00